MHSNNLVNLLHEKRKFPPLKEISKQAHIKSEEDYQRLYEYSINSPNAFWLDQANSLSWIKKPTQGLHYHWDGSNNHVEHTWFADGFLNVSYNCLDRHLDHNKTAIIWQGDEDHETSKLTYGDLLKQVCKFANVLKSLGINKGDRVCLYMPMIPELAIAMLACARIGAIHSVVFAGFSAESLIHRISDSSSKLVITSEWTKRGGKKTYLKEVIDQALQQTDSVENVIVVKRTQTPCERCSMNTLKDKWYHELMQMSSEDFPPERLNSEDPLFILYTSGSTGKPKGVVHTQAGYLLYTAVTHKYVFDLQENDVYWCTADFGWITGHSYGLYGPLCNGSTIVMYEGIPTYPDPGRFWQIIDKYKINIFYTAPTVIRSLIKEGENIPEKYDLSSLRVLGTVGEPINPEAWIWYHLLIGKNQCPIVDTWWQTETGGILISALPGASTLKPGCANKPFFGIEPIILNENGTFCEGNEGGCLCIKKPWPGIMRTTWGNHQKFIDTYFKKFSSFYYTGDGCRKDEDGDYWLLGRLDDVVNISGHRIGIAEVESALASFSDVAEAAVVAYQHDIKGEHLYAYIILVDGATASEELKSAIKSHIKNKIGSIAIPEKLQFVKALPKTRSGKIMRRILRKIAENKLDELGDISTLSDPSVIKDLTG